MQGMRQTTGWIVLIAALGMGAGLVGLEIQGFESWADGMTPAFVGKSLGHLATVIAAFVSGQLVPTSGTIKKLGTGTGSGTPPPTA